ncbi:AAA family ATPase [Olsenella urininfantis]|uniref:AAA family ATPase n=1 Tax=Olsenella urininfantis TaxID=1871033 RepID=UPI0009861204|nr:P-loop NTPase [Olsenella urininfantis]
MAGIWLGCTGTSGRRELERALRSVDPRATLSLLATGLALREGLRDEEPGSVGAIVGLSEEGVSDVNLAAALAADGLAREVVLVVRRASGSLRSRSARAGIDRVIDLDELGGLPRGGTSSSDAESLGQGWPPCVPPRVGEPADGPGPDDRPCVAPSLASLGDGAPVLAFASGRGGVGKTAIVSCCAALAAAWGMRVAVLDLDLSCGNVHSCFGLRQGSDLAGLAKSGLSDERMGRSCARLAENAYLWGPCERPEEAELFMPHAAELISYLRGRHDLVLVDCSTTFTEGIARALVCADRLILVGGPEASALGPLGRTSALAVRLGVARTRIARVENFADLRVEREPTFGRAEVGLESARVFRIPDGGSEPGELLAAGEAVALALSRGEFAQAVSSLLAQLLSELGALPNVEAAEDALKLRLGMRRFSLFGRRREA